MRGLTEADLERGQRGEWDLRGVLHHLILSGWHYAGLMAALCDQSAPRDGQGGLAPTSADEAEARLGAGRAALLHVVEGVDEESFYRMRDVGEGGQTYSMRSAIADAELHDRQHLQQMLDILEGAES